MALEKCKCSLYTYNTDESSGGKIQLTLSHEAVLRRTSNITEEVNVSLFQV